ncbi:MAG: 3-hydroxyacyl-CoA dehydrogenase family protein [bacterium]|nr:3-hydroxyacyl-CoA dehydrogenase family protein [bacterium]
MASRYDPEKIRNIAVIGGGYVGYGVAQKFAQAGYPVAMFNRTAESSRRAMADVAKGIGLFVEAELLSRGEADAALARVRPVTDLEDAVQGADYIAETLIDDLAVKQEAFCRIDAAAPAHAIIASGTSGLRITEIAARVGRPERCITAHNLTPPSMVPAMEVVGGEKTDPAAVEAAIALLKKVGWEPVRCAEVPGNIGSRLTTALRREISYIIEQGYATPEAVDTVVRSLGRLFPVMGMCALSDFTGIDMSLRSQTHIRPHLDSRPEPSPLMEKMVEAGKLGVKSGEGFYRWPPEKVEEFYQARGEELLRWMKRPPPPSPLSSE